MDLLFVPIMSINFWIFCKSFSAQPPEINIFSGCISIISFITKSFTNSQEFFDAYEYVLKKLRDFKPEFLLFSAGFDAHKDDPLSNINLQSKDYFEITKRTLIDSKDYCNGNVVSILEGGYDLNALAESTEEHVKALIEF